MFTYLSSAKEIARLRPIYEKLGKKLVAMHKVEFDLAKLSINKDASAPEQNASLRFRGSPTSEDPPSLSDVLPALTSSPNSITAVPVINADVEAPPPLQELVRFVAVSAGLANLRLRPHDRKFNKLIG